MLRHDLLLRPPDVLMVHDLQLIESVLGLLIVSQAILQVLDGLYLNRPNPRQVIQSVGFLPRFFSDLLLLQEFSRQVACEWIRISIIRIVLLFSNILILIIVNYHSLIHQALIRYEPGIILRRYSRSHPRKLLHTIHLVGRHLCLSRTSIVNIEQKLLKVSKWLL